MAIIISLVGWPAKPKHKEFRCDSCKAVRFDFENKSCEWCGAVVCRACAEKRYGVWVCRSCRG